MEKEIIIASKYRVIRKIGEGGTAKVYLAYDTIFERNVALKIFYFFFNLQATKHRRLNVKYFQKQLNLFKIFES